MAIKGKKKSQSRGSQARRRPAAAPRPLVATRGQVPWYRTPGGRVAVAVAIVIAVSAVGGIIAIAGSDSGLEARQRRIQDYTQQVRAVRAELTTPATQMAGAATTPDAAGFKQLGRDATRWTRVLGQAQGLAGTLQPPTSLAATATLFSESINTYASAANMFQLATTIEGDPRVRLLALAAAERERALQLWTTGLRTLDSERRDAEMDASGLQPPAAAQPAPPVPPPTSNSGGAGKNK